LRLLVPKCDTIEMNGRISYLFLCKAKQNESNTLIFQ
jgi:hypothetical protein